MSDAISSLSACSFCAAKKKNGFGHPHISPSLYLISLFKTKHLRTPTPHTHTHTVLYRSERLPLVLPTVKR